MPTVPTVAELFQFVANAGTILAIVAVALYEFRRRRTKATEPEDSVVSQTTCNAVHAATDAKISDLCKQVDSLSNNVDRLTMLVEKLAGTVGELNTALAVLADREGQRLEELGPRPRKRVRG